MRTISAQLTAPLLQLPERIDGLQAELKKRTAELGEVRVQLAEGQINQLIEQRKMAGQVSYVVGQVKTANVEALRSLAERLQERLKSGIVVLGAVINDYPNLAITVSSDLVKQGYHAGKLARKLSEIIGGGGGGKPSMAQAGGRDAKKLPEALELVSDLLKTPVQ
jgi:alanyl-tRNA synthetase